LADEGLKAFRQTQKLVGLCANAFDIVLLAVGVFGAAEHERNPAGSGCARRSIFQDVFLDRLAFFLKCLPLGDCDASR
jgi:hypothetical protein